ncbi:MAG: hypothetical protein ACKO96_17945 [Flammeovirgaceae bacterium]
MINVEMAIDPSAPEPIPTIMQIGFVYTEKELNLEYASNSYESIGNKANIIKEPNKEFVPASSELASAWQDLRSMVYPYLRSFKNAIKPKPSPKNPPKAKMK